MGAEPRYIIAGQGIAGTVLALTLLNKGHRVMVVDDPRFSSCSSVAAGNINPILLRRLVKTWKADEVVPFALDFYPQCEKLLGASFFRHMQILRVFGEEQEQLFWKKAAAHAQGKYLSSEPVFDLPAQFSASCGAGMVHTAANVNVKTFLAVARKFLADKSMLLEEEFDFGSLELSTKAVRYKKLLAEKLILCQGWKALDNPYFSWLPFHPAKGETLIVRIKGMELKERIVQKGVFILPLGNELFKVGATYAWDNLDDLPTEKAKAELEQKLNAAITSHYEVVEHSAGVRPAVRDRRPLLGIHPEHPSLAIFNGLGTKGVMLAPYFAAQLVSFFEEGIALGDEVSINRFEYIKQPVA